MAKKIVCPSDNLQEIFDSCKPFDEVVFCEGVYRQKLTINVPNLTLTANCDATIVFSDHANKIHSDGKEFNTFRTFSVAVCADNIKMQGLTIQNDTVDPKTKGQCVALSVNASNFSMHRCRILSTQDTLFCGPLPDDLVVRYLDFLPQKLRYFEGQAVQYFEQCEIFGSVDFIFGCGNATFKNCQIVSINDGRAGGFVTAPAHSLKQKDGFKFLSCHFSANDDVLPKSVYLARPWRDFGKCEFFDCTLENHIHDDKFFYVFGDADRTRTARFFI